MKSKFVGLVGTIVVAVSMCSVEAKAAVSASIAGGTSYVHLGTVTAAACVDILESPVVAPLEVAVDGRITSADKSLCHEGVRLDLVSTAPVVTVSKEGITMWPLDKAACVEVAAAQTGKGKVLVNGKAIATSDQIQAACSKSSNTVTGPR